MNDNDTTIGDIRKQIDAFMTARNWSANHKPAHVAMSISIEAAELLEFYQWGDKSKPHTKEDVASELSDVITYAFLFANVMNIDISAAIEQKMKKVAKKFPVSQFNADNDSLDDYWAIKKKYREEK